MAKHFNLTSPLYIEQEQPAYLPHATGHPVESHAPYLNSTDPADDRDIFATFGTFTSFSGQQEGHEQPEINNHETAQRFDEYNLVNSNLDYSTHNGTAAIHLNEKNGYRDEENTHFETMDTQLIRKSKENVSRTKHHLLADQPDPNISDDEEVIDEEIHHTIIRYKDPLQIEPSYHQDYIENTAYKSVHEEPLKQPVSIGEPEYLDNLHMINLQTAVIDENDFPTEYWSRLEKYFYSRFCSSRPTTREVGVQLGKISQRTAATMATPAITSTSRRCFGVFVQPVTKEVGTTSMPLSTREFGCITHETNAEIHKWLEVHLPKCSEEQRKTIHQLIRSSYSRREEFVEEILRTFKRDRRSVGIDVKSRTRSLSLQARPSRSISPEVERIPEPVKMESRFIQARPLMENRSMVTDQKQYSNTATASDLPLVRSQGSQTETELINVTASGSQTVRAGQLVERGVDAAHSYVKHFSSGIQTNSLVHTTHEDNLKLRSQSTEIPVVLDQDRVFVQSPPAAPFTQRSNSLPRERRLVSNIYQSKPYEPRGSASRGGYSVATESRCVDEMSQRHLLPSDVSLEQLKQGGNDLLQEALSRAQELGTSHHTRDVQPKLIEVRKYDSPAHPGTASESFSSSTTSEVTVIGRTGPAPMRSYSPPIGDVRVVKVKPVDAGGDGASTSTVVCGTSGLPARQDETDAAAMRTKSFGAFDKPNVKVHTTPLQLCRNYRFTMPTEATNACRCLARHDRSRAAESDSTTMDEALTVLTNIWLGMTTATEVKLEILQDFIAILNEYSPDILREVIQFSYDNGSTSLHYAVGHNALSVVDLILDSGYAQPNRSNAAGFSPITVATTNETTDPGGLQTLARLFNAGDVNLRCFTGTKQTPLMMAASNGNEPVVKLLLSCGARINDQDTVGNTPLMFAVEHDNQAVIQLILQQPSLDLRIRDCQGKDVLDIAQSQNNTVVVDWLLKAKAAAALTHSNSRKSLSPRPREGRKRTKDLLYDLGLSHQLDHKKHYGTSQTVAALLTYTSCQVNPV